MSNLWCKPYGHGPVSLSVPTNIRRVFIPQWWASGFIFKNLAYLHPHEVNHFLQMQSYQPLALFPSYPHPFPMLRIWNEILNVASKNPYSLEVQMNVSSFFSGTQSDILQFCNEIVDAFKGKIKFVDIRNLKNSKRRYLTKTIKEITFIKKASIIAQNRELVLHLIFEKPVIEYCTLGKESGYLLHFQDTFLQWFFKHKKTKLAKYFLFQMQQCSAHSFLKEDTLLNSATPNDIINIHKDNLNNAKHYYDYGIFNWSLKLPSQKITDLVSPCHSMIYGFYPSASNEPFLYEIKKIQPEIKESPKNQNDLEFLHKLTEVYESLTPVQKKSLERDKKIMSDKQFKNLMNSYFKSFKNGQNKFNGYGSNTVA